jgi:hypothetical protein
VVGPEEDRMPSGRDLDLGRPDVPAGAGLDVIHGRKMAYFFAIILYSAVLNNMSLCSKLICFIP